MSKVKTITKTERIKMEEQLKQEELLKDINYLDIVIEDELKDINQELSKRGMEYQSKKETICNKIREIYMETNDPKIKTISIEAMIMAKKMAKKLLEYRKENLKKDIIITNNALKELNHVDLS